MNTLSTNQNYDYKPYEYKEESKIKDNKSSTSKEGSQSTRNNSRKTIEDYTFPDQNDKKAILGQGSYGTVKLAIDKATGVKYAIKIFCTIDNLKREIKIQRQMNHPNICKLFHYFEDKQNVYLVLEYAQQGSLFHCLRKAKKFNEEIAFRFFYQTCLGIDHLHKNSIIHRDLKPENLLIDGSGNVKLCDFGWSAEQRNSVGRTTFCGTVDYMPPEMIGNKPHDHRVDIWCLGVLLYELAHGFPPFTGKDDRAKLKNISLDEKVVYDPSISKDLEDLIRKILQKNPIERISLEGIFRHPWMMRYYKHFGIDLDQILIQQNQNTLQQKVKTTSLNKSIEKSPPPPPSNQNLYSSYEPKKYVPLSSANDISFSNNSGFLNTNTNSNNNYNYNNYQPDYNNNYSNLNNSSNNYSSNVNNNNNYNLSSSADTKYQYRYDNNNQNNQNLKPISQQDEDEYYERLKRISHINNEQGIKNKGEANKQKDETFFDRILIAFGCISRDKK